MPSAKYTYSVAEAKTHLPRLIHAVEAGTPIEITRRGETVAVLLSLKDFQALAQGKKSFGEALTHFRKELQHQTGLDAQDLGDLRDRTPGRAVSF